jgi:predicted membrane metal-binding protein
VAAEQGLRATGYVRPAHGNQRPDGFVVSVGNLVERSRAALRERILAALPGRPYANVIVALVVGDQRGIEQSDWQVFNRTGIGHLISISGLHITMVAGLFALVAYTLWRWSFHARNCPCRCRRRKWRRWSGLLWRCCMCCWLVSRAGAADLIHADRGRCGVVVQPPDQHLARAALRWAWWW